MNYFVEQGLPFGDAGNEADKYCDFYASKNWHVGKNKMKDWKSSVSKLETKDAGK